MDTHNYAVIMAGGGGTRLWPVSRKSIPKQLLKLFGERSLIQISVDRLTGLFAPENIYIVTVAEQAEALQVQVPQIPFGNYLIEPMPRGTAAVVAMAAAALQKKDPQACLAILTADHFIARVAEFQKTLQAAFELAEEGYIVTMGIKPTYPSTGYGYIESGEKLGEYRDLIGYKVNRFVEKPDEMYAISFLKQSTMNWNSGMFITRADVILAEFSAHMPELASMIQTLLPLLGNDHSNQKFIDTWSSIQPQTIDYGIMEKSSRAAVIQVSDLGWNDVGSWDSFFDMIEPDENGNIVLDAVHIGLGTKNSLIVSTEPTSLVVTLGMENLIVVKTPDAILICPRGESQRVKELVLYLKENNYNLFL